MALGTKNQVDTHRQADRLAILDDVIGPQRHGPQLLGVRVSHVGVALGAAGSHARASAARPAVGCHMLFAVLPAPSDVVALKCASVASKTKLISALLWSLP